MSRTRRQTRVETRLEALEGRITPTATSLPQVVGAQILMQHPAPEPSWLIVGRAEAGLMNHYRRVPNPLRAEIFLHRHPQLEAWYLQQVSPRNVPATTTLPPASGGGSVGDPVGQTVPDTIPIADPATLARDASALGVSITAVAPQFPR